MPGERPALIQVVSLQRDARQEETTLRRTYSGALRSLPQGPALAYTETDEQGADTRVLLASEAEGIRLRREGLCSTDLLLAPGQERASAYETPYGAMELTVRTHEAVWLADGQRVRVRLRYDVYVAGELLSQNEIRVACRAKP